MPMAWINHKLTNEGYDNHFMVEAQEHCHKVGLQEKCKIVLLLENCSVHLGTDVLVTRNVFATYLH